jgi:hypothetical protein
MMKRSVLIALLLLFGAVGLEAQGLYLGPQGGYEKPRDADTGKFMGGAALRLKLPFALGAEASINYRQDKFLDGAVEVKSWPVMVTAMFYPIPIVYGGIGAGWFNTTIEYEANKFPAGAVVPPNETRQEFGYHFGAGVELPLGPIRLTGDIRYVFLNYKFETIPGRGDSKNDFYVITAGLLFKLF